MTRFYLPILLLAAASCSPPDESSVTPDAGAIEEVGSEVGVDVTVADTEADAEPVGPVAVADKTIHRLNRAEYDNTVRDLLGTSLRPSADFPNDDIAHGFDNVADVLTLSPVHVELYAQAARRVVVDVLADPEARSELLICEPEPEAEHSECLERVLAEFLTRAWRRPVQSDELERWLGFAESVIADGDTFETAVALTVEAALVSPNFLFRVEHHPQLPDAEINDGALPLLDGYAIASRLSYFLWSSMPDTPLFEAAADGRLQTPEGIEAEVRRMLQDPRSVALVDNFGGQWLHIRNVETAAPDVWSYPEFDDELRAAMREEMDLFFETFITEDRSMLELLTGDDSFVDPLLAAHYGLDDFAGDAFERVYFSGIPRGGLLGQAGLLTSLSYPTRTSPVRRGKFILGQLLCQEPSPPPPGVEGLPEAEDDEGLSLRERMEQHRNDPTCASCHATMDELGFGLENYDGIGQWRDAYGDDPIDASGLLPDGREFLGGAELGALIAADPAFPRCVTQKLFIYAMGRPITLADRDSILGIEDAFESGEYRFEELAVALATSVSFRVRANVPVEEGQ